MRRYLLGLAATATVLAAGCVSEPTGDLTGVPTRIVTSYSKVFLEPGDSILVTAELRDEQNVALPVPVQATAGTPAVASVAPGTDTPLPRSQFFIKGESPGAADVTVTAEGVDASIRVIVNPVEFDGTVSVVSTGLLDTLVITSTSALTFDASGTTGVLVDGVPAHMVSVTATEIKALAIADAPLTDAVVTLTDVVFLGGTEDEAIQEELDATTLVDVRGQPGEPNDDLPEAVALTVGGAAIDGVLTSNDIVDYFTFTLAAPATVTVTLDFEAGVDVDGYVIDDTFNYCDFDGCAGGTSANPEVMTATLPAGTYYIEVYLYDLGGRPEPTWYRVRIQ